MKAKGNATSSDIIDGKTAIVNGEELTGTYHGYEIVETGSVSIYLAYGKGGLLTVNFQKTYTAEDNVHFVIYNTIFTSGAPYVSINSMPFKGQTVGSTKSFYSWNGAGSSAGDGTFTFEWALLKYR